MFYSTQILAKKGPLGTIWIAAHLERRLKRHQVFETSITLSVGERKPPSPPLPLRTSSSQRCLERSVDGPRAHGRTGGRGGSLVAGGVLRGAGSVGGHDACG